MAQGFSGKPRLLAELLLHLAADDAKYSSFFWWKDFYRVDNSPEDRVQGFCQICQQLHEDNQVDIKPASRMILRQYLSIQESRYPDLHGWWVTQGNCSSLTYDREILRDLDDEEEEGDYIDYGDEGGDED